MKAGTLLRHVRNILSVQVVDDVPLDTLGLLSLPPDLEIGEVLPTVDPKPDSSLDLQDNWNQDLLDHL